MEDATVSNEVPHLDMTADIVSAYVSNNRVAPAELPALIASIHATIAQVVAGPAASADTGASKATPAEIKRSITADTLISFEDGKPYKTLRRHLTLRGLTPEAYRAKYGLPSDYPMTSAAYSAHRSELAKSLGLGQQRRKSYVKTADAADTVAEAPAKAPRTARSPKAAESKAKASKPARARKSVEPAAAE